VYRPDRTQSLHSRHAAGRGRLWLSRSSPQEDRYTANSQSSENANSHIYGAQMLLFDNAEIVFFFSLFHLSHPFPSNERRDSLTRSPARKLFGDPPSLPPAANPHPWRWAAGLVENPCPERQAASRKGDVLGGYGTTRESEKGRIIRDIVHLYASVCDRARAAHSRERVSLALQALGSTTVRAGVRSTRAMSGRGDARSASS
jgi:hypothetical protein